MTRKNIAGSLFSLFSLLSLAACGHPSPSGSPPHGQENANSRSGALAVQAGDMNMGGGTGMGAAPAPAAGSPGGAMRQRGRRVVPIGGPSVRIGGRQIPVAGGRIIIPGRGGPVARPATDTDFVDWSAGVGVAARQAAIRTEYAGLRDEYNQLAQTLGTTEANSRERATMIQRMRSIRARVAALVAESRGLNQQGQ